MKIGACKRRGRKERRSRKGAGSLHREPEGRQLRILCVNPSGAADERSERATQPKNSMAPLLGEWPPKASREWAKSAAACGQVGEPEDYTGQVLGQSPSH